VYRHAETCINDNVSETVFFSINYRVRVMLAIWKGVDFLNVCYGRENRVYLRRTRFARVHLALRNYIVILADHLDHLSFSSILST